jgi:hypothetical protein
VRINEKVTGGVMSSPKNIEVMPQPIIKSPKSKEGELITWLKRFE